MEEKTKAGICKIVLTHNKTYKSNLFIFVMKKQIVKYKELLFSAEFFRKVKEETNYYTICLYVGSIVLLGEVIEFVSILPFVEEVQYNLLWIFLAVLASPFISLALVFALAWFIHQGVLYIVKGQPYLATWKVIAYASIIPVGYNILSAVVRLVGEYVNPWQEQSLFTQTPAYGTYSITMLVLLGIIVCASFAHQIIVAIRGLREYYPLALWQAIAVLVIPTLVFVAIIMSITTVLDAYIPYLL